MAHTKAGGSTKLGRDSASKRLGIKRQQNKNVKRAKDDTLYASKNGVIKFIQKKKIRFDGNVRYATMINVE